MKKPLQPGFRPRENKPTSLRSREKVFGFRRYRRHYKTCGEAATTTLGLKGRQT